MVGSARGVVCAGLTAAVTAGVLTATGGPAPAREPTPPPAAAPTVPDQVVERGALSWRPCADEPEQRCARMRVPRDWARVGGAGIHLAVRRLPATGNRPIGTLVVNAGGPGEDGAGGLSAVADDPVLRRHFDLVSWDPRGVGDSGPHLRPCRPAVLGDYRPLTGPFSWGELARQAHAARAAAAGRCLRGNPAPHVLGTWQVAQDLEALRSALGVRRLTFVGYSYGTTVGRVYAQLFGSRLRALLLDGVTSPVPTFREVVVTSRAGGRAAWAWLRGRLPAGVRTTYRAVNAALAERAEPDLLVTRWQLWRTLLSSAKGGEPVARATAAICQYAQVLAVPRPGCRDTAAVADTGFTPRTPPIVTLVDCADRSGRPTARTIGRSLTGAGPTAGMNALFFDTLCAGVPEPTRALPRARDVRLRIPPLLVNGMGDPATPFRGARRTAAAFPGARLLAVDTARHGIVGFAGNPCVQRAAHRYLLRLRLPAPAARCPG